MEDLGVNEDVDEEEDMVVNKEEEDMVVNKEEEDMLMHKEKEKMITMIQTRKKEVLHHQEPVEEKEEEVMVLFKII